MPKLDWDAFLRLSGAPSENFEALCRSIVRRHYQRFGRFREHAQQPGVEFHLELEESCDLGDAGTWFGWQCRWWDLPAGTAIGKGRKDKIVKAIRTSEVAIPGLTDWYLWTRRLLSSGDQKWFYAIETDLRLHLLSERDIDCYLTGPAEALRRTYFGELGLSLNILEDLHRQGVVQLGEKWRPKLHQEVDAERKIELILGRFTDTLSEPAACIAEDRDMLAAWSRQVSLDNSDQTRVERLLSSSLGMIERLSSLRDALSRRDILRAQALLDNLVPIDELREAIHLARKLRNFNSPMAIPVQNLQASLKGIARLASEIGKGFNIRLVAVPADAGFGKTELAASITSPRDSRPAGILLHGGDLAAYDTLDDLATQLTVAGEPIPSIQMLLEALDAAGERHGSRIPIAIDGLNEAEDPRRWKRLTAKLGQYLDLYPNVLVVLTLRSQYLDQCLPDEIHQIQLDGFGDDLQAAIRAYFRHYNLRPREMYFEWHYLRQPLLLRIFCEVASRDSDLEFPASPPPLAVLLDSYLETAAQRIEELAPHSSPICSDEVLEALELVGTALWDQQVQDIPKSDLRKLIGDEGRLWKHSIVRALEAQGIWIRAERATGGGQRNETLKFSFDSMAGVVIGRSILRQLTTTEPREWFERPDTRSRLHGDYGERHPLAEDIFQGLLGLFPDMAGIHLWQLQPHGEARTRTLLKALESNPRSFDTLLQQEIHPLLPRYSAEIFEILRRHRSATDHEVNSTFLDKTLEDLEVAERDLLWTEWLRRNERSLKSDLFSLAHSWRDSPRESEADGLAASWVKWTLTSTSKELRDAATYALYWFGRADPKTLFSLTEDSLRINDPYVPERMLAATYGVLMSHVCQERGLEAEVRKFLSQLAASFASTSGEQSPSSRWHYLARLYVGGIFQYMKKFFPGAIPEELAGKAAFPYSPAAVCPPVEADDPRSEELELVLHSNFRNYTIGRLFDDRGNYDMKHIGHQEAVAHVLGSVRELGWSQERFGDIDSYIDKARWSQRLKAERYGKKYSRIGFFNHAGMLAQEGRVFRHGRSRLSDVDIDPSFPLPPPPADFELGRWTEGEPEEACWQRSKTDPPQRSEIDPPLPGLWVPASDAPAGWGDCISSILR